MLSVVRFKDLVERRLVKTWSDVRNLQRNYGFPAGRMLNGKSRTWTEAEIDEWYEDRPVENSQPLRGMAKALREDPMTLTRKRREAAEAS